MKREWALFAVLFLYGLPGAGPAYWINNDAVDGGFWSDPGQLVEGFRRSLLQLRAGQHGRGGIRRALELTEVNGTLYFIYGDRREKRTGALEKATVLKTELCW